MATAVPSSGSKPFLSPRAKARMIWLKVHRWLGLGLLLVMFVFGATGSALVWPQYFDGWINPDRYSAASTQSVQLDELFLRKATAALPEGDSVSGIRIPPKAGAVLIAGQVNGPPPMGLGPPSRAQAWLHPVNGEALDRVAGAGGFVWALHAIHGHLLLSTYGREVVALSGLFLFASAISGIWLWWPGWRRTVKALRWQKGASVSLNLHRQTGALAAIIIIIEAVTGAYIAVPQLFVPIIEPGAVSSRATMEGPPRGKALPLRQQSLEQVVAAASNAAGKSGALPATIFLPTIDEPVWKITYRSPQSEQIVRVADKTGEAVLLPAPPPPGRAQKVERVLIDIHFGHYGIVWQIIVFLSGIVLAILPVTGLLIWLQKCQKPKRKVAS